MNRRKRLRATRLLTEMGIIVFSVVLALGANEWRQSRAREATVATVKATMRAETEQNRAQVERALAHHVDLVSQLRSGGIVLARIAVAGDGLDTTSATALARSLQVLARARGAPADAMFVVDRVGPTRWQVRQGEHQLLLQLEGDSAALRGPGNISLQPAFLVDSAWETAQVTQAAVHMEAEIIASLARVRQLSRLVDSTVSRVVDILYAARGDGDIVSALQDLAMFEQHLLAAQDDLLARLD